jgi:putative glutamine amidotransferase
MKSRKPIIGITLDSAIDSEKNKYSVHPWYALRKNYANCVIKAGGIPVMLPYDPESVGEIIDMIDALIIPGGDEDIHLFTRRRTHRFIWFKTVLIVIM